jgi:hypothetical protein
VSIFCQSQFDKNVIGTTRSVNHIINIPLYIKNQAAAGYFAKAQFCIIALKTMSDSF